MLDHMVLILRLPGKSNTKSKVDGCLMVFFPLLVVSYFMWSGVLDSPDLL